MEKRVDLEYAEACSLDCDDEPLVDPELFVGGRPFVDSAGFLVPTPGKGAGQDSKAEKLTEPLHGVFVEKVTTTFERVGEIFTGVERT